MEPAEIAAWSGLLVAVIGTVFAGVASLMAARSAGTAKTTVKEVAAAIEDPVTGLKPIHELTNSNMSEQKEINRKLAEAFDAATSEIARLNRDMLTEAKVREALATTQSPPAPKESGASVSGLGDDVAIVPGFALVPAEEIKPPEEA